MAELSAELRNEAFTTLPRHFVHAVLSYAGQAMRDGSPVPGAPDGLAAC